MTLIEATRDETAMSAKADAIRELSAHLHAANARLAQLLADFTADDTWNISGDWRSLTHWLGINCGFARAEAEILARVAAAAEAMPTVMERAGRGDIPVGLGIDKAKAPAPERQAAWIENYDLARYPGKVHRDGIQAMIDLIMQSPEPITVIVIGPTPNMAAALEREPRIAERARFVGMEGSVRLGYNGKSIPVAEWNVRADPQACQKAFTAPWEMIITPLDTCGLVDLTGEKYRRIRDSRDPISVAIMENYRAWQVQKTNSEDTKPEIRSTTLFDAVAVYLAFDQSLCHMETLGIRVTDDGFTVIDPEAKKMSVATSWKDLGAFEDLLVARLTGVK